MTNRTGQPSRGRAPRLVAFTVFTLLSLCLPGVASAQWATSGTTTSTTNNVGIGTSTPTSTLEVQGPGGGAITLSPAGDPSKATVQATLGGDLHLSANARFVGGTWGRYDLTLPSWNFFLAPVAGADFAGIRRAAPSSGGLVWTDIMRFTNAGNVGIGTTAPAAKFTVSNNAGLVPAGQPGTVAQFAGPNGGISRLLVDSYGDGTSAAASIDMRKANNTAASPSAVLAGNLIGQITWQGFGATSYSSASRIAISGFAAENYTDTAQGSILTFQTTPLGAIARKEVMRLDSTGNVGIGTNAPAAKLDVNGDIRVSGNINAKYQDVAEWVPSTQKLAAGTVVVLDPERPNHVLASNAPYDTAVAGVISARPGLSLGEAGEGKALVATTGRVKVKVDATKGAIKVGDLLVTSGTPGVAMKSQPLDLGGVPIHRPGTLIGKALEPLEKGTGEILVLLSLQ